MSQLKVFKGKYREGVLLRNIFCIFAEIVLTWHVEILVCRVKS